MNQLRKFFYKRKYELLFFALVQHLFIGIFLCNLPFYTRVVWPINMLILGIASTGVFLEKGKWKSLIRNLLFIMVLVLPIMLPFANGIPYFMSILSIIYVGFFSFIFFEIIRFLIKPGYINVDIISASACGYFLLIEICVFLMQVFLYYNPDSFKGIDTSGPAATFIDLVYFSSITLTSIGFGDITPNTHYTKLITSFFGIAGQFYMVVLIGIIISKFSSRSQNS